MLRVFGSDKPEFRAVCRWKNAHVVQKREKGEKIEEQKILYLHIYYYYVKDPNLLDFAKFLLGLLVGLTDIRISVGVLCVFLVPSNESERKLILFIFICPFLV